MPRNEDSVKAAKRRYYERNRQAVIDRAVAWNRANPERAKEIQKACAARNPARGRACLANYRASKRSGGKHTAEDRHDTFLKFNCRCPVCGSSDNLTIDHIVPLRIGGGNHSGNLQTLCGRCNSSKSCRRIVKYSPDGGIEVELSKQEVAEIAYLNSIGLPVVELEFWK